MAARRNMPAGPGLARGSLVAVPLLAVGLALPLPGRAQVAGPSAGGPQTALGRSEAAVAERHIAALHARLHITPEQEPLWQPLATAMRDSVAALDRLYAQRGHDYESMSAVDNLKSYGDVQETNARNVRNLVPPLERLYASFSPSQKRQADETFRRFTEKAAQVSR